MRALEALLPNQPLNKMFLQIIKEGTGKAFSIEHNREWMLHTRPILEAFFHARFFLEMAVNYGKDGSGEGAGFVSAGWAAFLYLYDLR